jgi:class 3 adenylate cyclase
LLPGSVAGGTILRMVDTPASGDAASSEALVRGRQALARHAWREAFDLLAQADLQAGPGGLVAADLEALSEAALFTPELDAADDAKERAFNAYLAELNPARAAYLALEIGRDNAFRGRPSIASAWVHRAERLLDDQPESYAHGYLALVRSQFARMTGDIDAALAEAQEAIAIAERARDKELRAWGQCVLGALRIAAGEAPEGLALLEEASILAVNGELTPYHSGLICCQMITACHDLTDYQRATEWIEATDRYCQRQSVSGFPGACRIHRAEIVALGGGLERAEGELVEATAEFGRLGASPALGLGFYALGEVRRIRGDLPGAEEALRQAHAMGVSPHPALALIRLAQGKIEAAANAIDRAVAEGGGDRWSLARLLVAQVEIAIAAGHPERAATAANRLAEIVTTYPSPALQASVHVSQGRVRLAEQDATAADRELREGIRLWREVGNPYEVARARILLAQALHSLGDGEDAALELRTARDEFTRLGAATDLAAAERAQAAADRRFERPVQVRKVFMFSDIVGSTRLAEVLGNEAWEGLLQWHDRTLRLLIERSRGHVINGTGDGFFAAFDSAESAVESAIAIQRALAEQRQASGFALDVRIGLHSAEANRRGDDFSGMGVHVAARVAALAGPGEILATEGTIAEAATTGVADRRQARLKGVSKSVAIASIVWR